MRVHVIYLLCCVVYVFVTSCSASPCELKFIEFTVAWLRLRDFVLFCLMLALLVLVSHSEECDNLAWELRNCELSSSSYIMAMEIFNRIIGMRKKKETNEWILLLTPIKSILAQEGNQHKSRCAYQLHSSSPTQIIRAINYHPPFIMTAQDRYFFRVEFICSSFFACIWIGEKEWMWECYHKRPNHYIIYATNCCGYE